MQTETADLIASLSFELEKKYRHLSDHPAEGHSVDGVEDVELSPRRLRRAKTSYTARAFRQRARGEEHQGYGLRRGRGVTPKAGDLVLARIATIGQHKRLESYNSRRRNLFMGDEVIVAYGDRYAPDQFLAEVPRNLNYTNLVAAGGMASRVIEKHENIDPATVLEPLGLITRGGEVVSLSDTAPHEITPWEQARETLGKDGPTVVVVFGSSMNSGKSTTVGCLVNGLVNAGLTVHAGKATGTGAGNDAGLFRDAGAEKVVDFTDFGLPSTFRLSFECIKDIMFSMTSVLSQGDPDVVVIEIADGIYQGETAALVADPEFGELADKVLFACGEALSAAAGVGLLQRAGLPLVAVSGLLTSAPLIAREASAVVDVPVIPTYDLCEADVALRTLGLDAETVGA
ncbi:DUF1611 domain-containing protein [Micrococcus endophyticus]|uniref:DUF1611 domain-containing protein n=1 Tax=Micrococcus endophyticus TaxID=455343 RepID=UPI0034D014D4